MGLKDKLEGLAQERVKKGLEDARERAELNRPEDDKAHKLLDEADELVEQQDWKGLHEKVQEIEKYLEDEGGE